MFRAPRFLAGIIAGLLRSNGIECSLSSDDFDGWYPHMDFTLGTRVLVREIDHDRARQVIEEAEPLEVESESG